MSQLELWQSLGLAALLCALMAGAAPAQEFVNPAESADTTTTPDDALPQKIQDRLPVEIDQSTLADTLNAEPLFAGGMKPWRRDLPQSSASWNKTDNSDGSAKYSVSKPLTTPWDAKIGADISTAAPPPDAYDPRRLPGTTDNAGSGSAWANLAVPHLAIVEVRAEPANDYDKFGTKLQRSVPIGKSLSVTAQSNFGVTELRPTVAPADASTRLFDTDNSLQLNILSTGTTLLAGATTITGDPVTHSRVSAGQKIYGPFNITGSIYDPGQPTTNLSITAGMNFAW
jgi:hypothetical protein